jgi:hypothetical protein
VYLLVALPNATIMLEIVVGDATEVVLDFINEFGFVLPKRM